MTSRGLKPEAGGEPAAAALDDPRPSGPRQGPPLEGVESAGGVAGAGGPAREDPGFAAEPPGSGAPSDEPSGEGDGARKAEGEAESQAEGGGEEEIEGQAGDEGERDGQAEGEGPARPSEESSAEGYRAGFVAIIGAPNAGKSSLMNRLLGSKVAIVTAKPQTTRHRILGVMTSKSGQIVFMDTPGVHRSQKPLNQALLARAKAAASDADVCLWLIDGAFQGEGHEAALELVRERGGKPLVVAINKADLVAPEVLRSLMEEARAAAEPIEALAVSALKGRGLRLLRRALIGRLPKSPPLFDDDALTDQTMRAIAAEYIREAVFELARQEIPYSTAVTIDTFKEPDPGSPKPVCRIEATIHVERESQKRMVIGKGGLMLKKVGTKARIGLEEFLEWKVFLSLFVRLTKDWTGDKRLIEVFGYGDR
jgi:GTP-binding protein Era